MVETIQGLTYGTVTGRFLAAVADSTGDQDIHPDGVPLSGTVTFTPSAPAVLITSIDEPVTVLAAPIIAVLDALGHVSLNGQRGVELVATDDPYINPTNFTYTVSFSNLRYAGGAALVYKPFAIEVPGGQIIDLSAVAPVPSSGGATIVRGEAGASAYELWLRQGNTGSVADFLGSLKGPKGDRGPAGSGGGGGASLVPVPDDPGFYMLLE